MQVAVGICHAVPFCIDGAAVACGSNEECDALALVVGLTYAQVASLRGSDQE